MKLEYSQSQNLKQLQRLILSPQMQQALHLLQLPVMELATVINEELQQNPLLEYGSDDETPPEIEELPNLTVSSQEEDPTSIVENTVACEMSLFDLLMAQAKETFKNEEELALSEALIGNFDGQGFLTTSLDEIALLSGAEVSTLEALLYEIQSFDPPGVGARTLQESLLIQLRLQGREETLAFRIIEEHFDALLHNRIPLIANHFRQSAQEIREIIETEIARLDLRPGTNQSPGHYKQIVQHITPDVTIMRGDEGLSIRINEDPVPSLRLNTHYLQMLKEKELPEDTRSYLQEKMASGRWLMRNLHERHHTLHRIAEEIVKTQAHFFAKPSGKLTPLTMKEVAQSLQLHESTVARAVANKYLYSPRGMLPLRSFFTHAYLVESGENISATTVKDLLKEFIAAEDRHHPLSDEKLSTMIRDKGIPCARRTVAKYRLELGIGNTTQRKIF